MRRCLCLDDEASRSERGLRVSHTTILSWVVHNLPESEEAMESSWRIGFRKRQFSFGPGGQRRFWSLKQFWEPGIGNRSGLASAC
jgi:hypothetical protein